MMNREEALKLLQSVGTKIDELPGISIPHDIWERLTLLERQVRVTSDYKSIMDKCDEEANALYVNIARMDEIIREYRSAAEKLKLIAQQLKQ